jgi:hypothetical protein
MVRSGRVSWMIDRNAKIFFLNVFLWSLWDLPSIFRDKYHKMLSFSC